jgi:type I restriction enzyme R subunit
MSELLGALIAQRKQEAIDYQKYLERIVDLAKKVANPASGESYPVGLDTPGKRALFDNLGNDLSLALAVDQAVRSSRQDDWRNNPFKIKKVRLAIKGALNGDDELAAKTLELVANQNEY